MRICSPQLGLSPRSILGGEIYDHEILKGLARLGVKIEILLPKNRSYDKTIKNWNVKQASIKHIPALLYNVIELPYLFSLYRQRPFQILRLHTPYFTGIGGWFFKLFHPQVKLVATYHQARRGFPFDQINKLFIHSWDLIITDSRYAKLSLIKRFDVNAKKIIVIPGGAPANLKTKPHGVTAKSNFVTLLFMGLLIPRKNPLFIIEVIKKLIPQHPQIRLILCGDGPLKTEIQKKIRIEKLQKNISLHRPVFGREKQQLYHQADIFVHPALHEGFPLVVLEAMASDLPIIISQGYSAPEAVSTSKNGFLAKTSDLNDWVVKINTLVNDRKIRIKMGQNSRQIIEQKFTWNIAAKKHYQAFSKLIKQ